MTITSGLMSSNTDQWATPQDLFDRLDAEFHFTLDVCADETNRKVAKYFDKAADGLAQDWTRDVCWMNPPYGREIPKWVRKARITAEGGGDGGRPAPGTHGHPLVGGRHGGRGAPVHPGTHQVRGKHRRRTLPLGHRNMGDPQGPNYPDDVRP